MKIKNSFFVIMLTLSILPLSIWSYFSIDSHEKNMEKLIEENVKLSATMQVTSIRTFFSEQDQTLDTIVDYQIVLDIISSANSPDSDFHMLNRRYMNNMLKMRIKKNKYLNSLTLLDRNFKVLACSQEVTKDEISVFKEFDKPLSKTKTTFYQVNDPASNNNTKKKLVGIKTIYQEGNVVGYLIEEINLLFFKELRLSASVFDNGTIYILDDERNFVSAGSTTSDVHDYVMSESERAQFSEKMKIALNNPENEGFLRYAAFGGYYITYFSKLDSPNWIILASVNIERVLARQQSYKMLFFTMLFLVILVLVAANYLVSFKITKPVTGMIKTLDTIKNNSDYSRRISNIKSNEMQTLANGINSLLGYIEEHINEQNLEQQKLQKKAQQDPLTGLYNKKEIQQLIQIKSQEASQNGSKFALIFVDIDDFKNFNSKYGHLVGDKVLVFVGNVLAENYGSYIGRVGGDEFVACISNVARINYIEDFTQNILETLNRGIDLETGTPVSICCSIGIVINSGGSISAEELLEEADNAMYNAKEKGKNNYDIIKR